MAGRRFGVELHQYLDATAVLSEVALSEAAGYDAVWLGDSQLIWRELHTLMGAASVRTSRVALGIGVTNPITRHPSVTASAALTLQELSGGRALLGVGLGYTSVHTLGLRPATLSHLETFVQQLRALWAGQAVRAGDAAWRLAYAAGQAAPPIVVAASGPKMLRLAGRLGDGVILVGQVGHPDSLRAMLDLVHAGRREAGREDQPFLVCVGVAAAVHADRALALSAVRSFVAQGLLTPPATLTDEARAASDALRQRYDYYDHMNPAARHAAAVPDHLITQFAVAGTPDECREQAARIFAAGVDEITIRPYAVDGGTRATTIQRFADEVVHAAPADPLPARRPGG